MSKSKTKPRAGTQRAIILDELIKAQGYPVGLNMLMRISNCGAVHSQIDELRKKYGACIVNEQTSQTNGRRQSMYKLTNWEEFTSHA